MKVYTEAGKYELTAADTAPFCINGNDIEIVGPAERVTVKLNYELGAEIMRFTGRNIILRNIEFDIDFLALDVGIIGEFVGIACQNCENLIMENCRTILRKHSLGDHDGSEDYVSCGSFHAVNLLGCHGVTLISTLSDIRQTLPDGTIVRYIVGENGAKLYVNGYPIATPKFIEQ